MTKQDMRQSISQWLALSGFDTETFASAEEALKVIGADYPGVVVSRHQMPGMDGMAFLKRLMSLDCGLPVIMITGHGDVPMAVEAMRVGAYGFSRKAVQPRPDDRACQARQPDAAGMTLDNRALRRELSDGARIMKKLIGASAPMERLREDILDLGQADGHVLIDGETGTGKTLVGACAARGRAARGQAVRRGLLRGLYRGDAGGPTVRTDRRWRPDAAGRGGAWRHAVP